MTGIIMKAPIVNTISGNSLCNVDTKSDRNMMIAAIALIHRLITSSEPILSLANNLFIFAFMLTVDIIEFVSLDSEMSLNPECELYCYKWPFHKIGSQAPFNKPSQFKIPNYNPYLYSIYNHL